MATLYVRNIPDLLYKQAHQIALAQGRSLGAYVRIMLQQAIEAEKRRQTRSKTLSRIRKNRRALPEGAEGSVALLRKIRRDRK